MKKSYRFYIWIVILLILSIIFIPVIITSLTWDKGALKEYYGGIRSYRSSDIAHNSVFFFFELENGDHLTITDRSLPASVEKDFLTITEQQSRVRIKYTKAYWPLSLKYHIIISFEADGEEIINAEDNINYWNVCSAVSAVILILLYSATVFLELIVPAALSKNHKT
ncbi:MAG: hypothetical protein IJT91_03770 [Clostridia bacterium]|nr:hypothetical protein [Clostridia bacterium]